MASAARAITKRKFALPPELPIRVGVDLGTAFSVMFVTDEAGRPLAGTHVFADVVRDGIVWDFAGAVSTIVGLKQKLEERTGRQLSSGAVTIPPGVSTSDHRAHKYVLEAAGIECTAVVDEPTAANSILGIMDGAVVDIGGGTTGIAVVSDGTIVATFDEPSGGTHMSLVIAGALKIPFEEAELLKRDTRNHARLFPIIVPVLEKMSTIVRDAIDVHHVPRIHLVGGTSAFTGIEEVMTRVTGVPAEIAPEPMLVTPLGVASFADIITDTKGW
ncbi:ethanolamine utilization protein EutJ [Tessaracoccus antarcticus]|nr:ethanolamine utilization protein EutJ [Tessaracoccus antarcticus]